MARRYARDNRGRFTSGGGGATARGGRLRTASGGKRKTVTAKLRSPATAGALGRKQPKPKRPANKIARTGKRLGTDKQAANRIRPYKPATFDGQFSAVDRRVDRGMKKAADAVKKARDGQAKLQPMADKFRRETERMSARAMQDRFKKGIDGEIAGITLRTLGAGPGRKAIKRRMERAAKVAGRGSKAGRRAQEIYANQMAKIPTGKVKAANNIVPGRGSKPKKKRGKRGKRKK